MTAYIFNYLFCMFYLVHVISRYSKDRRPTITFKAINTCIEPFFFQWVGFFCFHNRILYRSEGKLLSFLTGDSEEQQTVNVGEQ